MPRRPFVSKFYTPIQTAVAWHVRRSLSTASTTVSFNRGLKRQQRENAARLQKAWSKDPLAVNYTYFRREIAARLVDRLDDIRRDEGFPLALDVGAGSGFVRQAICADCATQGRGGIGGVVKILQLDSSEVYHDDEDFPGSELCASYRLIADEEDKLPFPDGIFDLVISSVSMHWVNNLPELFQEAARVLKPDGCFIFAMVGGTTLPELRASMVLAELERDGGVSPHVGPFVELSDVGALLQRAGFALPTIDIDTLHFSFPNVGILMEHLQRMGENNASIKRRQRTSLDTLLASACIYENEFPVEVEGCIEIEASVQVIYAIGWTPHASQQKPEARGTATAKIGDLRDIVQHHEASTKE
jgi:NADH dehydrogenase [ubiquinone] 1 alpha subcomplex assembly factor 5